MQALGRPCDAERCPRDGLIGRADRYRHIDDFDGGAGDDVILAVGLEPHLVEAGQRRRAQLALGAVGHAVERAVFTIVRPGGHDGDVVAWMQVGGLPCHREFRADHGLHRRVEHASGDDGFGFGRAGEFGAQRHLVRIDQRDLALGQGLADQIIGADRVIARRQADGKWVAFDLVQGGFTRGVGQSPEHRPLDQRQLATGKALVPGGCRKRGVAEPRGESDRHHGWRRGHDLLQRLLQLGRIVGGVEGAAGGLSHALHLQQRLSLSGDVEADHMGGEINPGLGQRGGGGAGVGVAGLDTVGDEDHGGRVFSVAQGIGGGDDRIGHRRHAARVQSGHDPGDLPGGAGGRGDHQFDVGTFAAFAVAIGHETEILVLGEIAKDLGHDITGDGDLVDPVDLSPHRTRGVEDEDRVRSLLCEAGQTGEADGGGGQAGFHQAAHAGSPFSAVPLPIRSVTRAFSFRKCEDMPSSFASHSGSGVCPSMVRK